MPGQAVIAADARSGLLLRECGDRSGHGTEENRYPPDDPRIAKNRATHVPAAPWFVVVTLANGDDF
jgi:hypothetical protein